MAPVASTTLPPFPQQPPAGAPLPPPRGGVHPPEQGLDIENPAPYTIELEVPGLERLARSLQSDEELKERIRQENRERRVPELHLVSGRPGPVARHV